MLTGAAFGCWQQPGRVASQRCSSSAPLSFVRTWGAPLKQVMRFIPVQLTVSDSLTCTLGPASTLETEWRVGGIWRPFSYLNEPGGHPPCFINAGWCGAQLPATFKLWPEDSASNFFSQVSAYSLGASYISVLVFNLVFSTRRRSQVALVVKNPPAKVGNVRDVGLIPGSGRCLEEGMTIHSSILAWRIPWTGEPGRLQSTWSQRVGHN